MLTSRRRLSVALAALFFTGCFTATSPTSDAAPSGVTEAKGYFAARDGTLLAYHLRVPGNGTGTYPTLLTYDGYDAGSNADASYAATYVPKGYAFIGVSVRGTGCSGGTFDFFEPVQALDGYDAVEWIAKQPWSNGKVGMIGKSYPGITQLFTASTRPPHLVAAAPGHVYGDIYRDVAYPGGIFNYAFAGLWSFVAQPAPGYQAAMQSQDPICYRHMLEHTAANARWNPFVQAQEHMWDDDLMKERSPLNLVENITVPLYLFASWQDEQVGTRGLNVAERITAPYYLTVTNGDHGMYRTNASLQRLERFFDHYVKGEENGFESEPRVQVWWDAGANGTRAPAWMRNYTAWPVTDVDALTLHLNANGALTSEPAAGDQLPDAYAYPAGTTSNGAGYGYSPAQMRGVTDSLRVPAPARVTYTTAPLEDDVVVLGNANFTFWAASTAADTDFQVLVSEVRPDGKVVYVQHGWLRASHREMDGALSSPFRPYQKHMGPSFLEPGEPTELSMEVFPVGHAFREGSRVRIDIEAPEVLPELWGFVHTPVPAVNLIYHDATHPSRLVLPVLSGEHPDVPLPACGTLIRQSCV